MFFSSHLHVLSPKCSPTCHFSPFRTPPFEKKAAVNQQRALLQELLDAPQDECCICLESYSKDPLKVIRKTPCGTLERLFRKCGILMDVFWGSCHDWWLNDMFLKHEHASGRSVWWSKIGTGKFIKALMPLMLCNRNWPLEHWMLRCLHSNTMR